MSSSHPDGNARATASASASASASGNGAGPRHFEPFLMANDRLRVPNVNPHLNPAQSKAQAHAHHRMPAPSQSPTQPQPQPRSLHVHAQSYAHPHSHSQSFTRGVVGMSMALGMAAGPHSNNSSTNSLRSTGSGSNSGSNSNSNSSSRRHMGNGNGEAFGSARSMASTAAALPPPAVAAALASASVRTRPSPPHNSNSSSGNGIVRRAAAEDIPVLESSHSCSFFSDGEDDDDDDDDGDDEVEAEAEGYAAAGADTGTSGEGDLEVCAIREADVDEDEEDGDEEVQAFDETRDLVPVLQTREDLHVHDLFTHAPIAVRSQSSKRIPRLSSWRTPSRNLPRPPPDARSVAITAEDTVAMGLDPNGSFALTSASSTTSQTPKKIAREVIRSGWLVRKGQHLKTWKRRFFVLLKCTNLVTGEYSASLQYYKGSNFSRKRGEIDLHDGPLTIRFVDMNERRRPYCFEIVHREFSLICQGRNDEDVTAWVCHLQFLSGHDVSVSAAGAAMAAPLQRVLSTETMDGRTIFVLSELRRLLCRSASSAAAKCTNFAKTFECRGTASLRKISEMHSNLTMSLLRTQGARILEALKERSRTDVALTPFTIDDLRALTSRHVEEVLYVRVQEEVSDYLHDAYGDDDSSVSRKLRWLQGKDQTYFNIPMDQLSRKGWIHAAKCLGQLNFAVLPTAKYEILAATLQEIRATYAEEHNKSEDADLLETDDLVPIFTYVLANSGADNLVSTKVLLTEVNGASTIGGLVEAVPALEIFGFAVECINNVTIPSALEDLFKDQVTLTIDSNWRNVLELEPEPTYRCGAMLRQISQHASNSIGSTLARKHVLVTVNGQNVALWPYSDIVSLLNQSTPPHRLAFIPCNSYYSILTTGKALWNIALANACQRGDISSVQMLLANGTDPNYVARESGGNMPLHIAVSALHFNVVSYLLQHGAKVKVVGECGRSTLHMLGAPCTLPSAAISDTTLMALHGSLDRVQTEERVTVIAKKLINHGAALEATDINGNTPLMLLAEKGYVGAIDALLDADSRIDLNARNWKEGMCALSLAARGGHLAVVQLLLENGAEPNLVTLRGDTPLHFAASIASVPICQALVNRGCDINERNLDGITPLMVAVSKGCICGIPLEDARKRQLEMQSVVADLCVFHVFDFMLDAGADAYAVCRYYRSALHYAAMFGGADVLEYISLKLADVHHQRNIDLTQRDLFGKSPLMMAEARHAEMAAITGVEEANGDEDEDSDIKLLRNSSKQRRDSGGTELIIDEGENGTRIIVAGSLDALLRAIFRNESYQVEDAMAMEWICDSSASSAIIDYLRNSVKALVGTKEGLQVRRMVLHALDAMVQSFMQRVEMDSQLCDALFKLCHVVFPFREERDVQCAHWLASSHLPAFVDAVRTNRLHELRMVSYCEEAYADVREFLKTAKDAHRSLKFLDDDLFSSSFGMEVISDSLRRRLTIAGVWTSETTKSGAARNEQNVDVDAMASLASSTPPAHPRSNIKKQPRQSVLDTDVNILAQQLTVLQHYMFSRIKISELLVSKKSAERTPAYDRVRQLHNHISLWVVNEILQRNDPEERAQILVHFIKVAGVCFSPLQNFDGFMAIMNAMNDSSVFRLKRTWGRLPPHVWDQWHNLKTYTESGARAMSKLIHECQPPCNPYLGVIMQNVIAIQEFPDHVEGELINFKKIRVLGKLVRRLLMMQKSPYLLPTDKRVLDHMCCNLLYADPEARYRQSLAVEPRVATTAVATTPSANSNSSSSSLTTSSGPTNQWAIHQRM